jgi:hypothetical protein
VRLLPTKPLGRLACGALALPAMILSSTAAHAADYPCFDEGTMQSARIHDLRINLMVNALKCRTIAPQTLSTYGRMLNSRADEFASHGRAVKASLVERYGQRQGGLLFDDYETRLGNFHSGTQASRGACEDTAAAIRLADRADHEELATLSRLVTNRGIRACAVGTDQPRIALQEPVSVPVEAPLSAPVRTERLGARWQQPAVLPARAEIVDGVETYAPGQGPNTRPAPLEQADPIASIAETPAGNRDAALAQAITALDAAAAALRGIQQGDSGSR